MNPSPFTWYMLYIDVAHTSASCNISQDDAGFAHTPLKRDSILLFPYVIIFFMYSISSASRFVPLLDNTILAVLPVSLNNQEARSIKNRKYDYRKSYLGVG